MKQKIPKKERWLHTPKMKAKLARADAWMRDTPPRETDLDELERLVEERQSVITHITPVGANIFLELGFPPDEAEALLAESDETVLRLTDDITESFMAQLFADDSPTYEPDDGPLTEAEINQVRAQAVPKLGRGPVLRHRSLLDESDD